MDLLFFAVTHNTGLMQRCASASIAKDRAVDRTSSHPAIAGQYPSREMGRAICLARPGPMPLEAMRQIGQGFLEKSGAVQSDTPH
jgi:hypothetical protein